MARQKGGQIVPTFARREKGTAIPVSARTITLPDGSSAIAHAINLSGAEVPDRTYFGGSCGIEYSNKTIKIMFAQPKLGGGLRSLLLISTTILGAAQFLDSVESLATPSLVDIATQTKIAPEPLMDFPAQEPEQTAEFVANIIAAAFSGQDACLDFYHANPYSVMMVPATNKLFLEPIVRVNTRTSLVLSLVNRLRQLKPQFEMEFGVEVGK